MAIGGAQAGHDKEAIFPLAANGGHLVARTDNAIQPRGMGQFGQSQRLIMGIADNAGGPQIIIAKAGQHGNGNHLAMFARRRLGIFHHRAATRGVNSDDGRLQHMDRLHGGGNRVGNVVQFEIKKYRQADMGNFVNAVVAMGAEKFQPQLQPANMALDLLCQYERGIEPGQVKRKKQGVMVHFSSRIDWLRRQLPIGWRWQVAGWG